MKIVIGTRMDTMKNDIRIINDAGAWIHLTGERCNEHPPYLAVKLDEGEESRLREWLVHEGSFVDD